MDVFRFAKLPMRANDPTRRYRIVRADERGHIGESEIGGAGPEGGMVTMEVTCHPELSDAAREDGLATARRFLAELVTGWGRHATEVGGGAGWEEQPDGRVRVRLAYDAG